MGGAADAAPTERQAGEAAARSSKYSEGDHEPTRGALRNFYDVQGSGRVKTLEPRPGRPKGKRGALNQ